MRSSDEHVVVVVSDLQLYGLQRVAPQLVGSLVCRGLHSMPHDGQGFRTDCPADIRADRCGLRARRGKGQAKCTSLGPRLRGIAPPILQAFSQGPRP